MKRLTFILFLILSINCISQEAPEYNVYSSTLCSGDLISFGEKSIQFKKVISDSRCPKGVTCVWAGEVKVLVEFFENGKSLGEKIISGSNYQGLNIFNNNKIGLSGFSVEPYPGVLKIDPSEYSLSLKVSEQIN